MKKPVYILGINESHTATAALLKDGQIIACASEERFTRKKGQWGYPKMAVQYCLKEAKISANDIEGAYFGFKMPTTYVPGDDYQPNSYGNIIKAISPTIKQIVLFFAGISPFFYRIYSILFNTVYKFIAMFTLERSYRKYITQVLGMPLGKINRMDHHLAHGMSAYYANPKFHEIRNKPTLVITNDGMGDDTCSKVYLVKDDFWKEIAKTPNAYTLGWLYLYVTEYLGMKPNEHEYKVMGLAPYCDPNSADKIKKIFKQLMWVDGLTIKSSIPMIGYYSFIEKKLSKVRFDAIAGGIQTFTEEILMQLITNAINYTKIHTIILGGGVFMNVKANMEISKLPGVQDMFVMPSCGDESTAIGAAYYGYKEYCQKNAILFNPKPLYNLYLGPQFTDEEIRKALTGITKKNNMVSFLKMKNPSHEIAKLLAGGEIIGRFDGRMEFGSRALGNRSILANPSNQNIIRVINEKIKGRDFWMPFAPIILHERAEDYLVFPNGKKMDSPFMMCCYETTSLARKDIIAAIHPYDYTARPQILSREQNPEVYDIIKEFENITKIGGLLNTSFNLHGEPVVSTPLDAMRTFQQSGLEYLVLGNYLVKKQKNLSGAF